MGTASDGYFLINGSMYGSWEGLDPEEIRMMTWGPCDEGAPPVPGQPPCKFRSGLKFFAERGLRQVIGGYYDYSLCPACPKNGTAAAEREFGFAQVGRLFMKTLAIMLSLSFSLVSTHLQRFRTNLGTELVRNWYGICTEMVGYWYGIGIV